MSFTCTCERKQLGDQMIRRTVIVLQRDCEPFVEQGRLAASIDSRCADEDSGSVNRTSSGAGVGTAAVVEPAPPRRYALSNAAPARSISQDRRRVRERSHALQSAAPRMLLLFWLSQGAPLRSMYSQHDHLPPVKTEIGVRASAFHVPQTVTG